MRATASVLALALAAAVTARAQSDGSATGSTPPETGSPVPSESISAAAEDPRYPARLNSLTVDAICQLMLERIRSIKVPKDEDYRALALSLSILCGLKPDDLELARMHAEAWAATSDRARLIEATRRIVRLDPADTVAQLRVINARITALQNADARLEAYAKLLGEDGQSLDPALRSRLALDAALLSRENGAERKFLDYLLLASTLDVTNKEAAALTATYYLDRTQDPLDRVRLLENVVLADPMDAAAHERLAQELMRHGAFQGAKRFLERLRDIQTARSIPRPPEQYLDYILTVWNTDGPALALAQLAEIDVALRRQYEADQRRRAATPTSEDDAGPPPPQLPTLLEKLRLAIHASRSDTEGMSASLRVLRPFCENLLTSLSSAQTRPEGMSDQEAAQAALTAQLDLLWARLLTGMELDEAAKTIDELAARTQPPTVHERAIDRSRGWLAAHRGDTAAARQLLLPIVESDDLARWAMGLVAEKEGNTDEAVGHYARLALARPERIIGSAAKARVVHLRNRPVAPTSTARALDAEATAFGVPWLDRVTSDPSSFMTLSLEHAKKELAPLDQPELIVRLRNIGRSPFAIGMEAPISPRILLNPSLTIDGYTHREFSRPEVVDLNRRLRLVPGEELVVRYPSARTWAGIVMDSAIGSRCTIRWRAVQGFVMDARGNFMADPLSISTLSDAATRGALDARISAESLAEKILQSQGLELLGSISVAALRLYRPIASPGEPLDQERSVIAAACAERLKSMNSLERAYTICRLWRSRVMEGEFKKQITEAIADDRHPAMAVISLLLTVESSSDPGLQRLLDSPDPLVRELALTIRDLIFVSERGAQAGPIP